MEYILIILCLLFQSLYLYYCEVKASKHAGLYKTLASLCFVILAFMNYSNNKNLINTLFLIGMCFDALGDILLGIQTETLADQLFLAGTGSFMVGHVFYLLAFFSSYRVSPIIFIAIGVTLGLIANGIIQKNCKLTKTLKICSVIYTQLIFNIAILSLGVFLNDMNLRNTLILISTTCFCASDCLLITCDFYKKEKWMHPVYLTLYYIAQIIMAFALKL